MKIRPITIIEPQIAAVTSRRLSRLRRPAAALEGLAAGDLLWIREPFHLKTRFDRISPSQAHAQGAVFHFAASLGAGAVEMMGLGNRRAARTLPRQAHRQYLEVLEVKLQPLQAITDAEVRAEGFASRRAWSDAWDAGMALGDRTALRWEADPQVLAFTFTLHARPLPPTPPAAVPAATEAADG